MSVASFLALLGYEAARLHQGDDPALARSSAKPAAAKSKSGTSQQPTAPSQSDDGYNGGGQDGYGGSQDRYGGGQGYYTPPATDPPTTGSS